jgi:hypothetical protein
MTTPAGACAFCGGSPAKRVADLAPGEPLDLCEECLLEWTVDALADELRRRGHTDPAVNAAAVRVLLRSARVDHEGGSEETPA